MPLYDCGRPECWQCEEAFRRKPEAPRASALDRDDLIQIAVDAMDNVHDMDVPWRTYAAAVVDALIEDGAIKLEGK